MSRPDARPLAAALLAALLLAGCGKGSFHPSSTGRTPTSAALAPHPRATPRPTPPERVALPLALTPKRAERFARAVSLSEVDLPGTRAEPQSKTPAAREREAADCGGRASNALGGGRSPDFQRGVGLDRESISSGVGVLTSAKAVRGDLAYASSRAGLACYARVLAKSLRHEQDTRVRVLGLHVDPLTLRVTGGEQASGIRIAAHVGIAGVGVQIRLYVDALSLPYGPAELDLYSTSFVQPVPERTQRELLELLRARARLHPL